MPKTSTDPAKLLSSARNRFENKLLQVEKIWATLSPHDYQRRQLVLDLTTELVQIDKELREWESKL